MPGFFGQHTGLTVAALFFVLVVSAVLFLYYFPARRRFGGTIKAGRSDMNGPRDE